MLKADAGIGIAWGKWMSSLPRLADHRARSRQVCDQVWQALKDRRQELLDANCELINQSINQSNPVLLKERVRIPRTRRAGGSAMLWGRLPLDGVGSCRLFFTDDLHDNLSWVPASDKPHTFKSCFTHSSQVFFGRPGPFLPGTGLDLTLFISPLERMTCPNHLSRRSRTRMARSHIPSDSEFNEPLTYIFQIVIWYISARVSYRFSIYRKYRCQHIDTITDIPICAFSMPWDDVTRRQSFMLKADAGIGIAWGKWMSSLPRLADHRARSRQVCDQVWQALKDRRQELLDANCELIVNLMSHWHTSSKLLFGTSLLEYHTGFRYIENTGVNTSIR